VELNHKDLNALAALIAKEVEEGVLSRLSPGRWLTLQEAMDYAKVKCPKTFLKWIDRGHIYGFKRSGQWIIDRVSIDDWYGSEKVD